MSRIRSLVAPVALLCLLVPGAWAGGQRLGNPGFPPRPLLAAKRPVPVAPAAPAPRPQSATAKPPTAAAQANALPGQQFTPAPHAAADHSPAHADHDVRVGDFYYRHGDYPGALSRYQGALRNVPHYGPALYGCGRAEMKLHHPDSARRYWEQYLESYPRGRRAQEVKKLLRQLPPGEPADVPQDTGSSGEPGSRPAIMQ